MKPSNTKPLPGWLRKTNTPSSAIFQNPAKVSEVSPVTQVNTSIFNSPDVSSNGPQLENLPPTDLRFAINRSREQSRYEAFRARFERANRPHYMINFVQAPIYILAPIQLQQRHQLFQQNH